MFTVPEKKLVSLLFRYGDHTWKCSISESIRNAYTEKENKAKIEDCDCGWHAALDALVMGQG